MRGKEPVVKTRRRKIENVPMVGIVVTISPSLSLYKMVVLPAASRPTCVCVPHFVKKDESVWSVLKSTRKTSLLSRKSEPKFLGERNLSVRALKTNRRDSRKVVSTSFPRESIRSNDAFIPRAYKRISFSHARASHPNAAKQRRNKTRAQKHTKIAIQKSLLSPPSLRFLAHDERAKFAR